MEQKLTKDKIKSHLYELNLFIHEQLGALNSKIDALSPNIAISESDLNTILEDKKKKIANLVLSIAKDLKSPPSVKTSSRPASKHAASRNMRESKVEEIPEPIEEVYNDEPHHLEVQVHGSTNYQTEDIIMDIYLDEPGTMLACTERGLKEFTLNDDGQIESEFLLVEGIIWFMKAILFLIFIEIS